MTVAGYFQQAHALDATHYPLLKYPMLPTVNTGSTKRPVYVPSELVEISDGQTRSKTLSPEMVGKMILEAAVKPNERMKYIANPTDSIVKELDNDTVTAWVSTQ